MSSVWAKTCFIISWSRSLLYKSGLSMLNAQQLENSGLSIKKSGLSTFIIRDLTNLFHWLINLICLTKLLIIQSFSTDNQVYEIIGHLASHSHLVQRNNTSVISTVLLPNLWNTVLQMSRCASYESPLNL